MSEQMAVESIVEAYWRLQGYWTQQRFPFQGEGHGWSDIDVLAYHPEQRTLVVCESKVRGPKTDVYAYTQYTRDKYGDIFEYDEAGYLSFLKNIKQICSGRVVFKNFRKMVGKLVIQLVSNYYIHDSVKPEVVKETYRQVVPSIPKYIKSEIRLNTTLEIICEVIRLEAESTQGRRYGHPIIDFVRELNRHLHPNVRYAGRGREETDEVKEVFRNNFMGSCQLLSGRK